MRPEPERAFAPAQGNVNLSLAAELCGPAEPGAGSGPGSGSGPGASCIFYDRRRRYFGFQSFDPRVGLTQNG